MKVHEHGSGSIVLDDLAFDISEDQVYESLQMRKKNPSLENAVKRIVEEVVPVARPKALYRVSYIERRSEGSLVFDGVEFASRILRVNTEKAERVFPYVVTAGRELEAVTASKDDFMRVFCLDAVKELVLESAIGSFEAYVDETYALTATAHMNPGSLQDWPIDEQPKLFSIFGDVNELVGVSLTESFLMNPLKSVSGVYFPTEVSFESCMLCPRHSCSKRRADYNPSMVSRYR